LQGSALSADSRQSLVDNPTEAGVSAELGIFSFFFACEKKRETKNPDGVAKLPAAFFLFILSLDKT